MAFGGLLLIRILETDQFADYIFALSVANFVSQSLSSSMGTLYILEDETTRLNVSPQAFLGAQLLLFAALTPFLLALFPWLEHLLWITWALALTNLTYEFVRSHFRKTGHFIGYGGIEILRSLFFVVILALPYLQDRHLSAKWVLFGQLSTTLIPILLLMKFHFFRTLQFRRGLVILRQVWNSPAKLLFIYFVLLSLLTQLDTWILRFFSNDFVLATYGSAFRYYGLMALASLAAGTVMLPQLKAGSPADRKNWIRKYHRMALLATLGVLALAFTASYWIPLIDKGRYPLAPTLFMVLSGVTILDLWMNPYGQLLFVERQYSFLFKTVCFALLGGGLLQILALKWIGPVGLVLAVLTTFAFVHFLFFARGRRFLQV